MPDEDDEGVVGAARGLAEGDRLVVVRAGRAAGRGRTGGVIGWPDRIPVTVQAVADEGVDVLVDVLPVRRRGGAAVEAPPGTSEPVPLVARIAYGRIRGIDAGGDGPDGAALLEVAYGRLDGPFSAWRAGGVPVTRFWRRGAWDRWRRQVRRGWRRRRERWTEWLRIGPVDVSVDTGLLTLGPLVVATGLVRYLKDPAEGTETELEEAVSSLLNELLEDALGDAVPLVEMLSDVSFEVTSPRSVRLVGYAVFDVGDFELRLRPFMADLARPPATSALYLAGEEDEIDEPEGLRAPPAVAPGAVAWPHAFQVRLRETWKTRVLPVVAPREDKASAGERVARALVAYLDRPSQDAADEIALQLNGLELAKDGWSFVEHGLFMDGGFKFTKVEVLSRTAIRLTGEAPTLPDDAGRWKFPVVVELALPPATSSIQIDADKPHVARFVLPPPPD
jgi:hypothetical protein